MLTRMAPVDFDPQATCPTWEKHLQVLFRIADEMESPTDEASIDFLQRAVGASLVGEVIGDHFFMLICGPKRTGKGVLIRTLKALLGQYTAMVSERVMFGRPTDHSTDVAALRDVRVAVAEELSSLQRLNVARLKTLTGGDSISARKIGKDNEEFKPSHTLWITANNLPDTGYESFGPIAERVRLLRTGPTVPYDARVADWPARIEAELPGILNWALEGLRKWSADGYRLPQADWMRAEVEEWETGQDPIGLWYDECLVREAEAKAASQQVFASFQNWWTTNRGKEKMPTESEVGHWLKEKGHRTDRLGKKKITYRFGVRVQQSITSPPA